MSERADVPTPTPPRPPVGFRLGRLGRLIRKELSEILRDRRTILTLVVMQLLLYTLLRLAFRQFLLAGAALEPDLEYRIVVGSEPEGRAMLAHLRASADITAGGYVPAVGAAAAPAAGPLLAASALAARRAVPWAPPLPPL